MINAYTKTYGVIGNPITHSLSPLIHNAIFKKHEINANYSAFLVDEENISSLILSLRTLNISGINVTVPFKEKLIEFLDKADDFVHLCGAVNTIVNNNGIIHGYNTDGPGFLYVLQSVLNLDLLNKNIVILGAGGTAKSIGCTLVNNFLQSLTIINRTKESLDSLKLLLSSINQQVPIYGFLLSDDTIYSKLNDADVVINTTSVGMNSSDKSLLHSMNWVNSNKICIDVIYNPFETTFLSESRQRGARTLNGLSMLAAQAMFASEYFTGKTIDFNFIFKQLTTIK